MSKPPTLAGRRLVGASASAEKAISERARLDPSLDRLAVLADAPIVRLAEGVDLVADGAQLIRLDDPPAVPAVEWALVSLRRFLHSVIMDASVYVVKGLNVKSLGVGHD